MQLTQGGDNAEAYFNFAGDKLVFQTTNEKWNINCDQIFITGINQVWNDSVIPPMISTGAGRTTCAYFLPGDTTILYSSTHHASKECPPVPERTAGGKYVWAIYPEFDIYVADIRGNLINRFARHEGYDAEATVSPRGDKIVFTSTRSGDLELYTMNIDGTEIRQITTGLGYDGGAFFSPDGSKLVFRASRPKTNEEINTYQNLLNQNLVMPTDMEIFVCDTDGSNLSQVTNLGKANWCPHFHPSGNKIIFSSNHHTDKPFPFNLFMINLDGTGLTQITFDNSFDAFPVFSPDGKKFVFSSNRHNGGTRATNIFIADWKE